MKKIKLNKNYYEKIFILNNLYNLNNKIKGAQNENKRKNQDL